MQPTINVDLSKALLRFSNAGIPEQVRNNLRRLIPGMGHTITNAINNRLNTQLKTRRTITVVEQMRENANQIVMRIAIESPSAEGILPKYLELGTKPHPIYPVNVSFLRFALGGVIEVYARKVMHPGTRPYLFMDQTVAEFKNDILGMLNDAVKVPE